MVEWFLWTLNDVIGELALSQEFQCLELRRMHPWPQFLLNVLKQTAAINQFRRFGLNLKLLAPFMSRDMLDARDSFLNTAKKAVDQRLAREERDVEAAGEAKKRQDIIGLMLREMKGGDRLSQPEIEANSILIVGGGAETTSTCLSGTFYHLCRTPRVMEKLKNDIRRTFATSDDITLQAVGKMGKTQTNEAHRRK